MTRALVALFLFIWPAFSAVNGTVTNRTTGKPQPGATVTLYKLGENGLESIESVKSDAQGKFQISSDLQGPRLIQTAYDGVTYNHMLRPGAPTTDVILDVYNSSKNQGDAKVLTHMVLLEPTAGDLNVSESYIFRNNGKTTYNDPSGGTLKFFLPETARSAVEVNATAPQGMPIRRAPEKTDQPHVYKVDFPIKPGESRIDVNYSLPFQPPGEFESKVLFKGGSTRLVVPPGVALKGYNVESLGQEPRTQATIYNVKGASFKVQIEGAGTLRRAEAEADENGGPSIEEIKPKIYTHLTWILVLALSILTLGFILLYRAPKPAEAPITPKAKNERRRR